MKKIKALPAEWKSGSEAETRKIGRLIASNLSAGDVVALYGDLGAGKTTLVKGIAEGLGVQPDEVSSPTYVVIHEYEGRMKVYHLDWYRLERIEKADAAMAEECFDSEGVTLVEWPERSEKLLPPGSVRVRLSHAGEGKRIIRIGK